MKRVAIHNLGCKVNAYEAESMEQMLQNAGYQIVPFGEEPADIYIINTCSVTNIADRKSRQMLHKAKKMNPDAIVVAAGCYVQAAAEQLEKDEAVDIVIGNNQKVNLLSVLEQYQADASRNAAIEEISQDHLYEPLSIQKVSEHTRAYIKIQDGCNQFCSYCIIPYVRGRIRSRALPDICKEVTLLAEKGYQEFVLTGIHLTSYGADQENGTDSLLTVIQHLAEIPGVKRIRLGSLEPRVITEEFASALSRIPQFCPHFHLSLQSGCDQTLARMNRHYTTAEYKEKCTLLRQYFQDPAITTDVIVGFPGETEEEFARTTAFLKDIGFYEMHIFKYSRRKGTVADALPQQVPEPVKTERSNCLLTMAEEQSVAYRKQFIGKIMQVLLEEPVTLQGQMYMTGYTENYIRVLLPVSAWPAAEDPHSLTNQLVTVETTGITADGRDLCGKLPEAAVLHAVLEWKKADHILLALGDHWTPGDESVPAVLEPLAQLAEHREYFLLNHSRTNLQEGPFRSRRLVQINWLDQAQWELYNKWLAGTLNKTLLILEIGEGMLQPNIIRWPFERITYINQQAHLYRINATLPQLPKELKDRSEAVCMDENTFIKSFTHLCKCDIIGHIH